MQNNLRHSINLSLGSSTSNISSSQQYDSKQRQSTAIWYGLRMVQKTKKKSSTLHFTVQQKQHKICVKSWDGTRWIQYAQRNDTGMTMIDMIQYGHTYNTVKYNSTNIPSSDPIMGTHSISHIHKFHI